MSEAAPAPAPAPTPAAAPSPAPAAPAPTPAAAPAPAAPAAPAPAPGTESLIPAAPAPAAAPAAAPAPNPTGFVPAEKMLAKGADGAVNYQESFQRAENARQHLERRLGAGDIPPAKPDDYVFTPPAEMADFKLDDAAAAAFKAKAHKWGMTQAQYEGVMGEYMALVPSLMQGGARLSAAAATEELKKVWQEPAAFQRGLADAGKATSALPADLQAALQEFGTNPAVLRALAYFGAEMRDPTPPNSGTPPGGGGFDPYSPEVMAIVNNPRHPRQAEVAQARQRHFEQKAAVKS